MFKQQVLKDIRKQLSKPGNDPFYGERMKEFINDLTAAECFHFPSEIGLRDLFKKYSGRGLQKFTGELAIDIKLPFKKCWLEFAETYHVKGKYYMDKHGALLYEVTPEVLWIRPCYYHVIDKAWLLAYHSYLVKVGGEFTLQECANYVRDIGKVEYNDIKDLEEVYKTVMVVPQLIPIPNFGDLGLRVMHKEWLEEMVKNEGLTMGLVNIGLMYMSKSKKSILTRREDDYSYHVFGVFKPRRD